MKVLIAGGSGFVGSHVADVLSDAGHNVIVYDAHPSPYIRDDQTMVVGDILDRESIRHAVSGCDYVYNFAGLADLDDARTKPRRTVELNILGNINIMEACVEAEVKRFIFASTIYVYSEKGGFYRCSKQASESYIEEFNRRYGLDYTILRYGTLYGPRADKRNSIYRYLKKALDQGSIVSSGQGNERREYIYVKDAALLAEEILDKKFANKRIILTGHQSIYFKDLLYTIREIFDNKVSIEFTGEKISTHYAQTPYSYVPKSGQKLTANPFTDLGQGLIECLSHMDNPNEE